jgi:predicted NAD/FAD-binding protein
VKIAVIGSGISGLTAAWLLADRFDVTVFESASRLGGHTNTVTVSLDDRQYALDTGFIVYNERNYPNFSRLLARLGVATQPSDMSFSVRSDRTGWEYCGTTLNGLFAQRRNLARPAFYRMLADIVRFNRRALDLLSDGGSLTLREYADRERFSRYFWDHYLIPMGAAIWSAPPGRMLEFPARHFVNFCANHGLLSLANRPQWRTVTDGAARYIDAMLRTRSFAVRLNSSVRRLHRSHHKVTVETADNAHQEFDHVIVAAHGDQALAMLADPSPAEREILGAFEFQRNEALLHTDTTALPHKRRAWASWNYRVSSGEQSDVQVTYWLNRLQDIAGETQFLVTLNDAGAVDPACVLQRMTYHHPLVTKASVAAQRRHAEISGQRRTHYCGAYWGYGFHEDGVNSAMSVARFFDESIASCTVASTKAECGTTVLAR